MKLTFLNLLVKYLDFFPVFISITIIPDLDINIIYLEFNEKIPSDDYTLNTFMFIFVKMSYKYTYLDVPTSKYFSFGDIAIYQISFISSNM